jgi:hypothetical protein
MQLAAGREVIEAKLNSRLATVANPTFSQALEWLDETKNSESAANSVRTVEGEGENSTTATLATNANASDKYDKAEDNLVTKLKALPTEEADAAAAKTIDRLKKEISDKKAKAFEAIKQAEAKLKKGGGVEPKAE